MELNRVRVPATEDRKPHRPLLDFTLAEGTEIGRELSENPGLFEFETLALILALLDDARGPRSFTDVGAHVGYYPLMVRSVFGPGPRITAFEAMAEMVQRSRALSVENRAFFELHEAAVGAEDGTATLYLSSRSEASNSLRKGFRKSRESRDVPLLKLDSVLPLDVGSRHVVKIDTETTEPDVLAGADEFIRRAEPWIIVEVLAGRTEVELMRVMESYRYHYYHIRGESLVESSEIVGDDSYQFRDWLFAPRTLTSRQLENFERWSAACRVAR